MHGWIRELRLSRAGYVGRGAAYPQALPRTPIASGLAPSKQQVVDLQKRRGAQPPRLTVCPANAPSARSTTACQARIKWPDPTRARTRQASVPGAGAATIRVIPPTAGVRPLLSLPSAPRGTPGWPAALSPNPVQVARARLGAIAILKVTTGMRAVSHRQQPTGKTLAR